VKIENSCIATIIQAGDIWRYAVAEVDRFVCGL